MRLLLIFPIFFALDFAAVFALEGIAHLTGAWPYFIPPVIVVFAALVLVAIALLVSWDER